MTLGQKCDDGQADACTGYGDVLIGRNFRDPAATQWFLKGCDLGDAEGCRRYARIQEDGRNWGLAIEGWAKGCKLGHRPSCHSLASLLIQDPTRQATAADLFEENCANGFAVSCTAAAIARAPLFGQTDCKRAALSAEKTCRSRVAEACAVSDACKLAVDSERPAALDRLRAACDRKVLLACLYWADAHPPASAQADQVRQAYEIACKAPLASSIVACPRLAAMDVMSAGSEAEAQRGLNLLEKQCAKSVGEACCSLAEIHQKGVWVTPQPERIAELRSKACTLGQSRCCAATGK